MSTILIIVLLVLLLGGGGAYYGRVQAGAGHITVADCWVSCCSRC
jgi:hypothetical protein